MYIWIKNAFLLKKVNLGVIDVFWNWVVGMIGIILGACIFATEFEDATFFTRFMFKLIAILLLVFSVTFIKWRRKKVKQHKS